MQLAEMTRSARAVSRCLQGGQETISSKCDFIDDEWILFVFMGNGLSSFTATANSQPHHTHTDLPAQYSQDRLLPPWIYAVGNTVSFSDSLNRVYCQY